MATCTSVGTGNWSAAGTWDTGVPANDDTVVIASGHTVTFDVDQSGFANGLAGLTITGTLQVSTAAGTYYLKMKSGVSPGGAGTYNMGTAASPLPSNVVFTHANSGVAYINGSSGLTVTVYGHNPTYQYARLSNNESSATRLELDTDVSGDWAVGDVVWVSKASYGGDERTITAVTSTYIDVNSATTATAGDYVVLISRNITVTSGTTRKCFQDFSAGKLTINSGRYYHRGFLGNATDAVIKNAVISNLETYANNEDVNNSLYDNCVFVRSNVSLGAFDRCNNIILNNCKFFTYTVGITRSSFEMHDCLFWGNTTGIQNCYGSVTNSDLGNGTYNLDRCGLKMVNALLGASTEHRNYTELAPYSLCESYDHDQTASAYTAWSVGGVTTRQTSTKPTGYTWAYQHSPESATNECFTRQVLTVPAGGEVSIELYLRKSASMTYLPRVYLMEASESALLDSGSAVDSFTMTDTTDTWESDTFTIDNSAGSYDKEYTLWFVCKNASGTVYSAYKITTAGGETHRGRMIGL